MDKSGHLGEVKPQDKHDLASRSLIFLNLKNWGRRESYLYVMGEWKIHMDFLNPTGDFERHLGLEGGHFS